MMHCGSPWTCGWAGVRSLPALPSRFESDDFRKGRRHPRAGSPLPAATRAPSPVSRGTAGDRGSRCAVPLWRDIPRAAGHRSISLPLTSRHEVRDPVRSMSVPLVPPAGKPTNLGSGPFCRGSVPGGHRHESPAREGLVARMRGRRSAEQTVAPGFAGRPVAVAGDDKGPRCGTGDRAAEVEGLAGTHRRERWIPSSPSCPVRPSPRPAFPVHRCRLPQGCRVVRPSAGMLMVRCRGWWHPSMVLPSPGAAGGGAKKTCAVSLFAGGSLPHGIAMKTQSPCNWVTQLILPILTLLLLSVVQGMGQRDSIPPAPAIVGGTPGTPLTRFYGLEEGRTYEKGWDGVTWYHCPDAPGNPHESGHSNHWDPDEIYPIDPCPRPRIFMGIRSPFPREYICGRTFPDMRYHVVSEYSHDFRNIDDPDEEMYVTCEKIVRNYKDSKARSLDYWEIREYCDFTNHRLPYSFTNSFIVTVKYDGTVERADLEFAAPFPRPRLDGTETGDMLTRSEAIPFVSPTRLNYINTDLQLAVLDHAEYRSPDKQDSTNGFKIYIDLNHIGGTWRNRWDKWSDIFVELDRNGLECYSISGPEIGGKIRNRRGTVIHGYSNRFEVDLMRTIFQGLPRK